MKAFATEFDVSPMSHAAFVAAIQAWVKGMRTSSLFDSPSSIDLDADAPRLEGKAGDSLSLLRHTDPDSGRIAMGFRHDFPDGSRTWRTEGVLVQENGADWARLRIRGLCIAAAGFATLQEPKKPYLIKALIQEGRVKADCQLAVQEAVHLLPASDAGLEVARQIINGTASASLPVVYVSTISGRDCALTEDDLNKLAFDLGGVAHVVREPDRAFSFKLKEQVDGRNVYGGAIGLSVPGAGIVRRIFLGWDDIDRTDLRINIHALAVEVRTNMATLGGWDWAQLQEAYARQVRVRDRSRLSSAEIEQLWDDELSAKETRIQELEAHIKALQSLPVSVSSDGILDDQFVAALGNELYAGEVSDRVLVAICDVFARRDSIGLDSRSRAIFSAITEKADLSGRAKGLSTALKAATKDSNRQATEVTSLLLRYGYQEKSDNKHIRLEAAPGYSGVETVTIPKTPGDWRGQKNLVSQIESALGLGWIKR